MQVARATIPTGAQHRKNFTNGANGRSSRGRIHGHGGQLIEQRHRRRRGVVWARGGEDSFSAYTVDDLQSKAGQKAKLLNERDVRRRLLRFMREVSGGSNEKERGGRKECFFFLKKQQQKKNIALPSLAETEREPPVFSNRRAARGGGRARPCRGCKELWRMVTREFKGQHAQRRLQLCRSSKYAPCTLNKVTGRGQVYGPSWQGGVFFGEKKRN